MSGIQQFLPPYVEVIAYAICAVYGCAGLYAYVAGALERPTFRAHTRLAPPLAVFVVLPRVILKRYDVPESIAFMLNTVSGVATLVMIVLAIRLTIDGITWLLN